MRKTIEGIRKTLERWAHNLTIFVSGIAFVYLGRAENISSMENLGVVIAVIGAVLFFFDVLFLRE